jgi:hypothetical protein
MMRFLLLLLGISGLISAAVPDPYPGSPQDPRGLANFPFVQNAHRASDGASSTSPLCKLYDPSLTCFEASIALVRVSSYLAEYTRQIYFLPALPLAHGF